MQPDSRRVRLAVALLSALLALMFSRALEIFAGPPGMWIGLIGGVVIAAWYGGLKPGIIATLVLLAAAVWINESGFGRPAALETPPADLTQSNRQAAFLFLLLSVVVSVAMQRLRMQGFRAAHAQARLREVLDSTLDAVMSVDIEFRCLYANQRAAELVNRTPGQMFSRSLRTIFPETPGVTLYRELARAMRERTPVHLEYRGELAGGHSGNRRYDLRGWPNAAGLTLFIRDITSVAESAPQPRPQSSPDNTALLDEYFMNPLVGVAIGRQDRILQANPEFLRISGHRAEELRSGNVTWSRLTAIDGEILASENRRVPVKCTVSEFAMNGAPAWVAFVLDISERRRLESQARETARLEGLSRIAATIVHDFNNLLTGTIGHASEALDQIPRDLIPGNIAARQSIQLSIRAAERASDLANQLMAFAGRGRFAAGAVDVANLIREVAQLMRAAIPRCVDLRLDLEMDLPMVLADSTQLQQLVMNLVLNSAQAVGHSIGWVEVSALRSDIADAVDLPAGAYVSIRVEDTGGGMDAATRASIFNPYFTTKPSGRGLGLAAANDIVRAAGGTIRVTSEPGVGSCFEVLLPALTAKPATAENTVCESGEAGKGWHPEGGTILLVEEDETVRTFAKEALERRGYTVHAARDGADAVEVFRGVGYSISLVLADLNTSSSTGEQTVRNLRALRASVPILVTHALNDEALFSRLESECGTTFVRKPYTADALAAKVRSTLDRDDD